jgi:putative hydrolase
LHVHTNRTDGEAGVDAILRTAVERKLDRIAFTEHVRRGSSWFHEFAREVREKSRAYPQLEVLVGCETKALDASGNLDASDAILADCDIVLGSVHRFSDGADGFVDTGPLTREEFAQLECAWALGLLRSGRIDVLAHPGGMYARRHASDLPDDLLRRILATSVEREIAVEVNSSYAQDPDRLLNLYDELNPFVSIASDMHRLERLGHCRDLIIERCGLARCRAPSQTSEATAMNP